MFLLSMINIIERLSGSLGKKSVVSKESERSENERKKRAAPGGIEHFGRGY
jgi:hypothetical protein